MKNLDMLAKVLEGIASLAMLFPKPNKSKITLPSTSISNTLKNDWEKIGSDMWRAFQSVESQYQNSINYRDHNDRVGKNSQERF